MGVASPVRVEIQFTDGIRSNVLVDTDAAMMLTLQYGIAGNRPMDCVASTGTAQLTLRNLANSGGVQGYYSPLHANKRAGWGFGLPIEIVVWHGNDTAHSVSGITRVGPTGTVITDAPHGRTTGDHVTLLGANQLEYVGTVQITVTGDSTFTFTCNDTGATPATGTLAWRLAYVKHHGKVRLIDPDAGQFGPQRVRVTSYDGMRDLAETDIRSIGLQLNKTESELVEAVLDAVPAESQPLARDLDAGVDVCLFAFDQLGGGVKALGVIYDIALSSYALVLLTGGGTLRLQNRHNRTTGVSAYTFDNSMHGLAVPSSLENVFNLVRVTIPLKTISAAADEELYTLPAGTSIEIAAGETREIWTDYTDPADRQTKVGGAEVVTALVGGVHYAANDAPGGGGADVTADLVASIEPFASTAKWTLTNTGGVTAYIVPTLKVIGKALRNPGPQTFEASSVQSYGTRPLNLVLPYQSDTVIAQSYATFIEAQYNALSGQIDAIVFNANASSDLLRQALEREPGDLITITEAVTGLEDVDAVIYSIDFQVTPGEQILCRFGLAPSAPYAFWQLGVPGASELGVTTVLGF